MNIAVVEGALEALARYEMRDDPRVITLPRSEYQVADNDDTPPSGGAPAVPAGMVL